MPVWDPFPGLMHRSKQNCHSDYLVRADNHRIFAERTLRNIEPTAERPQSALMLRARMTLPHFSVSSAMNLPKSAGEPANTVPPSSARRLLSAGSERPALISLLSFPMMSAGVFLGAPTPPQALASKPGKKSPTVGMSGSASERVAVVTASARSLPALMCSIDDIMGVKKT